MPNFSSASGDRCRAREPAGLPPPQANSKPRCQRGCWLNAFSYQQLKASVTASAYLLPHLPDTTMRGRPPLISFAFIALTACSYPGAYSTSQHVKFLKRGITQQQLDVDWSACRKENTVAMSFAEAYAEPQRPTSYAEEYLINGCMAAKGYTVTW
jgi:hypothetical protein